ncbi:aspartyl protease APCB1 isoform X4 [Physcomitrium patens]|uniref:aspartyl protease APCB1 isoform X4 n=1 Tax=Physcomitrium patens TaxID=3218 RepID=UPI000D1529E2|nr:aspartyl protease APCB1-like isoform X4 [Physcomitrium patens]XP_024369563.1 aspartyl protease APCB1-like isoform X4 [Physcomitrium patens]|eukprot:XP_024369562.1 aspartyl protease APCB1-like isoform X4 [Physcomitrella patens]
MNPSSWKPLEASPQRIQPGVVHRSWSIRALRHYVVTILVIALSTALIPWLQVLKSKTVRLEESYVVLPLFVRDYRLDKGNLSSSGYGMPVNTNRRLLVWPLDYIAPRDGPSLPPWDPRINTWEVHRHLSEVEALLFVKMTVANVTYFLDLDFRGYFSWINCNWKDKRKRNTFSKLIDVLKPKQLHGPNGLYVPTDENWCNSKLCEQLNSYENMSASCDPDFCNFLGSYGKEDIVGILSRDNVVLSNYSIPSNDPHYRLVKMTFGCVYKRHSKATLKRMKYKEKLSSDGVLGLNLRPLSFPSQLDEKNIAEHSIALCLANTNGVFAGYVIFGFPLTLLGDNMRWALLEHSDVSICCRGDYQVTLYNIKYGDQMVLLGDVSRRHSNYIILDGSSRFTYLADEIFVFFVKIVESWARKAGYESQKIEEEEGTCWSFWKATVKEDELIQGFKNVTFLLGSTIPRSELVIKPENYIISPKVWYALHFEVQIPSTSPE